MLSTLPPKRKRPRLGIKVEQREFPQHRAWVRQHVCSIFDRHECEGSIECAHVRTGTGGGAGLKPHDRFTISLCQKAHAEQHQIGERAFAKKYAIDLLAVADKFARTSPHRSRWETEE